MPRSVPRSTVRARAVPPTTTEDPPCGEGDPEVFFPPPGASTKPAKRICRRCAISTKCLEFALITGQEFGIWGGTTPRDRSVILKKLGVVK